MKSIPMTTTLMALTLGAITSTAYGKEFPVVDGNITQDDVRKAQEAWGAALIKISKTYKDQGPEKAREVAAEVLDKGYGYNMGAVMFKPTLTTSPNTFRVTKEGALSYFAGGNKTYPDTGFALKGWEKYEFENAAVHISGNIALTMGKVRITNDKGEVTEVDKTWGFRKDDQGVLRIILHHSSLPYVP